MHEGRIVVQSTDERWALQVKGPLAHVPDGAYSRQSMTRQECFPAYANEYHMPHQRVCTDTVYLKILTSL
jgi:hypothetical protein